jgi:hypothetical protein
MGFSSAKATVVIGQCVSAGPLSECATRLAVWYRPKGAAAWLRAPRTIAGKPLARLFAELGSGSAGRSVIYRFGCSVGQQDCLDGVTVEGRV